MTDIIEDDFSYQEFFDFAHRMLIDGGCAENNCHDYRTYLGPTSENPRCRKCFKDRKEL